MGGGPETSGAREAYAPKPAAEARNIQPLQPGFGMEKIPDAIKDAILAYGITMRNANVDGALAVELDYGAIHLTANGKEWGGQGKVAFDKNTLKIERYALRQDGFNNPDAPLRLKSTNRDGTVDDLVFEKGIAANAPEKNPEAANVDGYLAHFENTPRNLKNLMEGPAGKRDFDKIVSNWTSISDASVAKVKDMIGSYLRLYEGKGVAPNSIPANFALTSTMSQGHPALHVEGTPYTVFNDAVDMISPELARLKPDEKLDPIEMAEGQKKVELVTNSAQNGYMDGNYGYRGIVVDGKRYDIVPGSVRRLRDGGTTYSSFAGEGKKFNLYQPSAFKSGEKATISEA